MGSYRGSGTAAYTREEVLSGAVYAFRVVLESAGLANLGRIMVTGSRRGWEAMGKTSVK